MEQVKIFGFKNAIVSTIEEEVNDWLTKNSEVEITRIFQTESSESYPSHYLTISIFYKTK